MLSIVTKKTFGFAIQIFAERLMSEVSFMILKVFIFLLCFLVALPVKREIKQGWFEVGTPIQAERTEHVLKE